MSKKSIIEIIESNKKTLRKEFQRGYLVGFKEAEKRTAKEFLDDLDEFELKRYSDMIRTIKRLRKKYQKRVKE